MILQAILLASSSLPAAPVAKPVVKHFNKYDYAIYSGVVAYRIGDYWTTEHQLAKHNGWHEEELPAALTASKPGFLSYSLGMAALEIGASVYLHKHGHAKLARVADSFSVGAGTFTDIRNIAQKGGR